MGKQNILVGKVNITEMQKATGIPAFKIRRHLGIKQQNLTYDNRCDIDMSYIHKEHWDRHPEFTK